MRKHKFPKIQFLLLLSLAFMVILISLNSIIYILDVRNMNYLTQEIINHPYTVSNGVRDIEININAIHRTMKDVALSNNETQLNAAIKDVSKYETIIYGKFELIEEEFLGDLNTVHSAKQTFTNWKLIRDEVIDLVKENRLNEAAEITKGKGAVHVDLLFTKTHKMIEFANNKAKEFNANSINIMHRAQNKSLIIFLGTFLIGITIFLWLFNSISKPLNQFINRIRVTTKKQSTSNLPIQTNNKFVILDFAISELENRDKLLEEEINVRTIELKEARNLVENAIDNASIGMVTCDLKGHFINANHAFCEFTGYSKEELLKMNFNDLTPEKYRKSGLEFVNKVRSGKSKNESFEKSYIHKSGKIIYGSVTASVLMDSNKESQYLFAQIRDTSTQNEIELELIEHKNELENKVISRTKELDDKTNRLIKSQNALAYLLEDVNESQVKMKLLNEQIAESNKELEAFSYSVSHDLKAPLRAISGFSQILSDDYSTKLPQEAQRYLGIISDNAVNMGALINGLLSFSRLGRTPLQNSQFDLQNIVSRIEGELKSEIKDRKIKINTLPMPLINADESLLYHVMLNLISNAVKFTSKTKNPRIDLGCKSENNENIYYVKDNGIGFDMQYADKIFDVFQRLHSSDEFPGTGIGLSIVKRIIQKHNGRIWVQSAKNKGTTFFFEI